MVARKPRHLEEESTFCNLFVLFYALWLLPLIRRRVTAKNPGSLLTQTGVLSSKIPKAVSARQLRDARNTAWIVNGVSKRLPGQYSCLVRSLVLRRILAKRGIPAIVQIGVINQSDTAEFKAHAWVECNGEVINDSRETVSRFTPISVNSEFSWA